MARRVKMSKAQMNKAFGGILGETEKTTKGARLVIKKIQTFPLVRYASKDKTPTVGEFRRYSSKN